MDSRCTQGSAQRYWEHHSGWTDDTGHGDTGKMNYELKGTIYEKVAGSELDYGH